MHGWGPELSVIRLLRVFPLLLGVVLLVSAVEAASPLPDREASALLEALKSRDPDEVRAALRHVRDARDPRFVAPLIELLRADSIGIAAGVDRTLLVSALEQLSGQGLGDAWPAWATWYAEAPLAPPPGFTGWKGELLSRIDPRFGALLATGSPARIRVEEIIWGGVSFEGIPAIDRPKMIPAAEATYLMADEPIFGIALNGQARAYPLRILDWHEMANDYVGGIPVALTYCTLCGAGIAYDRRAPDGVTYDFGSSGLLLRSNKLMVDRQTRSLWDQFTGRPVVGPLVDGPDFRLRVLPSVVASWGDWRGRHPHTKVLSLETGHDRSYEPGAAYADYFAAEGTMFPVPPTPRLAPKTRVFGLEVGGETRAYPLQALTRGKIVHDRLGDTGLVLVAPRGAIYVEGRSARSGALRRYEAGAAVRAYASGDRRFQEIAREGGGDILADSRGASWRVTEEALVGPNEERLERVPGVQAYWFAWSLHHPSTSLYLAAK